MLDLALMLAELGKGAERTQGGTGPALGRLGYVRIGNLRRASPRPYQRRFTLSVLIFEIYSIYSRPVWANYVNPSIPRDKNS